MAPCQRRCLLHAFAHIFGEQAAALQSRLPTPEALHCPALVRSCKRFGHWFANWVRTCRRPLFVLSLDLRQPAHEPTPPSSQGRLSAAARISAEMLNYQTSRLVDVRRTAHGNAMPCAAPAPRGIRPPYVPALSLHVAASAQYAPASSDTLLHFVKT